MSDDSLPLSLTVTPATDEQLKDAGDTSKVAEHVDGHDDENEVEVEVEVEEVDMEPAAEPAVETLEVTEISDKQNESMEPPMQPGDLPAPHVRPDHSSPTWSRYKRRINKPQWSKFVKHVLDLIGSAATLKEIFEEMVSYADKKHIDVSFDKRTHQKILAKTLKQLIVNGEVKATKSSPIKYRLMVKDRAALKKQKTTKKIYRVEVQCPSDPFVYQTTAIDETRALQNTPVSDAFFACTYVVPRNASPRLREEIQQSVRPINRFGFPLKHEAQKYMRAWMRNARQVLPAPDDYSFIETLYGN